jgi:hypothetical protein
LSGARPGGTSKSGNWSMSVAAICYGGLGLSEHGVENS